MTNTIVNSIITIIARYKINNVLERVIIILDIVTLYAYVKCLRVQVCACVWSHALVIVEARK